MMRVLLHAPSGVGFPVELDSQLGRVRSAGSSDESPPRPDTNATTLRDTKPADHPNAPEKLPLAQRGFDVGGFETSVGMGVGERMLLRLRPFGRIIVV
jgi:hypothetical protein